MLTVHQRGWVLNCISQVHKENKQLLFATGHKIEHTLSYKTYINLIKMINCTLTNNIVFDNEIFFHVY